MNETLEIMLRTGFTPLERAILTALSFTSWMRTAEVLGEARAGEKVGRAALNRLLKAARVERRVYGHTHYWRRLPLTAPPGA